MIALFMTDDLSADLLAKVPTEGLAFLASPSPFSAGTRRGSLYPAFDPEEFEKRTGFQLITEKSRDLEGIRELVGYVQGDPPSRAHQEIPVETYACSCSAKKKACDLSFEEKVIVLLEQILDKMD